MSSPWVRRRGRRAGSPSAPAPATAGVAVAVEGTVRIDRRTARLAARLQAGDVAVVDHVDIDRASAQALVARRPAAVVNAAPSISGRYPNLGPEIIVAAGIPLLDAVGEHALSVLAEGAHVQLAGDELLHDGQVVARGRALGTEAVTQAMTEARSGLSVQLEAFAATATEYLRRERELLLDGVGVPDVRTPLEGREVLVVVRGHHCEDDLRSLRGYVRERRPVLVGVDAGADAIVEAGWTPDVVVGDMGAVSEATLRCGAEIVVHAYRDGRAPGLERVRRLGIDPVVFAATGTNQDVAMLLADDKGASLIVAAGARATLEELLDTGRAGMASTFLIRLRVGGKLVDAEGVSRLHRPRSADRQVLLLLASVAALAAAVAVTATDQVLPPLTGAGLEEAWALLRGLLPEALGGGAGALPAVPDAGA